MSLPCWRPKNVMARMDRARAKTMTCPASRHAAMIAEALMAGRRDLVDDEPEHCGVSIGVTVELLWKARIEIARLRAPTGENV